jgi:hypothetical protein
MLPVSDLEASSFKGGRKGEERKGVVVPLGEIALCPYTTVFGRQVAIWK